MKFLLVVFLALSKIQGQSMNAQQFQLLNEQMNTMKNQIGLVEKKVENIQQNLDGMKQMDEQLMDQLNSKQNVNIAVQKSIQFKQVKNQDKMEKKVKKFEYKLQVKDFSSSTSDIIDESQMQAKQYDNQTQINGHNQIQNIQVQQSYQPEFDNSQINQNQNTLQQQSQMYAKNNQTQINSPDQYQNIQVQQSYQPEFDNSQINQNQNTLQQQQQNNYDQQVNYQSDVESLEVDLQAQRFKQVLEQENHKK